MISISEAYKHLHTVWILFVFPVVFHYLLSPLLCVCSTYSDSDVIRLGSRRDEEGGTGGEGGGKERQKATSIGRKSGTKVTLREKKRRTTMKMNTRVGRSCVCHAMAPVCLLYRICVDPVLLFRHPPIHLRIRMADMCHIIDTV